MSGKDTEAELRRLREENAELRALVTELRDALELTQRQRDDLKWRRDLKSTKSHRPPSSDPPWEERPAKESSKKGKAKKKGRGGHFRKQVAEPTRVHELYPTHCRRCGAPLDPHAVVGKARVHQVTEIAGDGHEVDEYRRHQLRCGRCRRTTRAELPKGVPDSAFGPRLMATAVTLVVAYRLSRRQTQQALKEFWGVHISLGAIHRCEQRLSEAAARAVARVRKALRQQPTVHMDETGWRKGTERPWLWTLSTPELSSFWIAPRRDSRTALRLLHDFEGILCSDDYSAYNSVPLERRQLCWAHRLRDFRRLADYPYEQSTSRLGHVLLRITRHLFWALNRARDGAISAEVFRRRAHRLRKRLQRVCRWALTATPRHERRKYRALLARTDALWRFVDHDGVEPTNNCAERALRHAVIWRRISYGHRGIAGRLFVERMLTVVQTLRAQGRSVLRWMLAAASRMTRTPTLLPSG